ncbi:MAG: FAD-binding protein, partial [Nitrososphaerota archaeon]
FALGGHQALLPGDSLDSWLEDVVYFEDGLCEQDLVESIYLETYDRIKDLERLGVEFIKEADGSYRRFTTRGLPHVRGLRPHPHGLGGKAEVEALLKEALHKGVQALSRVMITEIITEERVLGALGFDVRSGEAQIFEAKAIIMATGQCSFKGHYADQAFSTGECYEMALRAGAELKNLEFVTIWMQPSRYSWEALGTSFPLGARLINAKGERFMENYSPLKEMIDFNYIARACAFEARKGNAPFYIDHSTIKPDDIKFLKNRAGWMKLHV